MRMILGILALAMLSACTTVRPMTLSDGSQGQRIACSGVQHSMDDCYVKAGQVCPGGYDVAGGGQGYGTNSILAASGGTNLGPIDRSLIVRCH